MLPLIMNDLLSKGYAEPVPHHQEEPGRVWYLPHHGVRHPQKRKLRIVFDCSATYQGISLNSMLLSGPNLTSSLFGVLTRFREGKVSFVGDIEAMFYQVGVPELDRNYLRFLWWPNGDTTQPLREFRMTVHLFGAASSPSVCNYALRRITQDFDCTEEVSTTIRRHFYVDDCLRSTHTCEQASRIISELCSVCSSAGFHAHKFVSNEIDVLNKMPVGERAKSIQELSFPEEPLPSERSLGLIWHVASDEFGFDFSPKSRPLTRRGFLAVSASLYDPLGIVCPFVLPAKLILQELCRLRIGWDDDPPDGMKRKWLQWIDFLACLKDVRISRWLAPLGCGGLRPELHVFADASSEAYGAVAYLRLENEGSVQCCFLAGKSRVKPLKSMTIPRMELTAAVLAVKIGSALLRELSFQPMKVCFHTDSTSVLYFISSPRKRFPVYIANRVQLILDHSIPSQWRYVPSQQNPADFASRGFTAFNQDSIDLWLHGPNFLRGDESEWPKSPCVLDSDEFHSESFASDANEDPSPGESVFNQLLSHYSDWTKLKKAVASYLRLMEILKSMAASKSTCMPDSAAISVTLMKLSEMYIIKYVQGKYFRKEIEDLQRSGKVSHQSSIYRLDPIIRDGILRVGGRLNRSPLNSDAVHPILLPKKEHVTTLIIRHYHQVLQHGGRNHILSALRERFWIIHSNAAVRSIIWKCVTCRKARRPPLTQKMASLPLARVTADAPFSHTGVDLFGPFHVTRARSLVKRYGVIFTCMACRAIHLEIAFSLDTDSFLNALRRFIARRGAVQHIYCDNGTNLVGAQKELHRAMQEQEEEVASYLLKREIQWHFNPPNASNMGGAWERLIRSVRAVLSNLLKEHGSRIDDESLMTLFSEAESIVNSRPLTTLSDNPDDCSPLTPQQLLTMKTDNVQLPMGDFSKEHALFARKRWRRVQYLSQLFWTRWRREFLQLQQLEQGRRKWTKKERNLQVGDLVMLVDDSLPRGLWKMGRIKETKPSVDGLVRSVLVRTDSSVYERPVNKCVLVLEVEEQ